MDMNRVLSVGITVHKGKLANNTILGALQRQHDAVFTLRRRFAIQLYGVSILEDFKKLILF
jgi:hypothetical protein